MVQPPLLVHIAGNVLGKNSLTLNSLSRKRDREKTSDSPKPILQKH